MKKTKFSCLLILLFLGVSIFTSCTTYAQQVGRWEKLGERTVDLSMDKDIINCSHKGFFTTIRFRVERAPVSFLRVLVKYANGTTDNLNFNQLVRPGGYSRFLDLRGNKRVIKQIVVYYKSERKARPGRHPAPIKARVEIWGRH